MVIPGNVGLDELLLLLYRNSKFKQKWKYNSDLAAESLKYVDDLLVNIEHVKTMNEKGIDTIIRAHQWGGKVI